MRRVRLLDDRCRLPLDARELARYAAAACLFWLAPSTRAEIERHTRCWSLEELVGGELAWGRRAYRLATAFTTGGPRHGSGLEWRRYLVEPVYRELHRLALYQGLGARAAGHRAELGGELVIEGELDARERSLLEAVLVHHPGVGYRALAGAPPASSRGSRRGRLLGRWREARTAGEWTAQAAQLLEALDPTFRHRARWGPLADRRPPPPRGAVTLLSSYRNNSRNLAVFAGELPEPIAWALVNDSARRGLPAGERRWSWLWSFGPRNRPGAPEPFEDRGEAACEEPGFDAWRRSSSAVASWLAVEQHLLYTLTACWSSYLESVRPRLVVVANQLGLEGWLAAFARERGVPVLQVMHGVLGGYLYTSTPIETSALVTYGEFWRRLWPAPERRKILAYRPAGDPRRAVARRAGPRTRLTFFSWPLEELLAYHAEEFGRFFLGLFARLLERGVEVTVRAHPQEDLHRFSRRWSERFGPPPEGLRLSKAEPLAEVLERTDVALMFRSTVMLDCLASGIPVVIPGWIDYVWSDDLEGMSGLCLAPDFDDLERALERWLIAPPAVDPGQVRRLLRPAGEGRDELERLLEALLDPST